MKKYGLELDTKLIEEKEELPTYDLFPRNSLRRVPASGGVYFLFNLGGEVGYIGQTDNILNRLKEHKAAVWRRIRERKRLQKLLRAGKTARTKKGKIITEAYQLPRIWDVNSFGYIVIKDVLTRICLEILLIKKFRPKYNIAWNLTMNDAPPPKHVLDEMNRQNEIIV